MLVQLLNNGNATACFKEICTFFFFLPEWNLYCRHLVFAFVWKPSFEDMINGSDVSRMFLKIHCNLCNPSDYFRQLGHNLYFSIIYEYQPCSYLLFCRCFLALVFYLLYVKYVNNGVIFTKGGNCILFD